MEQLEARAMGRPTEHVETTVAVPESIEALHRMPSEQRRALLIQLTREGRMPMLRAVAEGQEH